MSKQACQFSHFGFNSRLSYIIWAQCSSLLEQIFQNGAFDVCGLVTELIFGEPSLQQFFKSILIDWWNGGVTDASFAAYSFAATHNIPARFGSRCNLERIIVHKITS